MDSFASFDLENEKICVSWKYPELIKERKKLKSLYWRGGFDLEKSQIVTEHGVLNGKIQISRCEVETNNSGRSLIEQAILELKHKYHLKVFNEGYKNILENANTEDKRPFPMLAMSAKIDDFESGKVNLKFPVYIQPKIDGIRCISFLNVDGNVEMYSRERNPFEHLIRFFEEEVKLILNMFSEGTYLDGELYVFPEKGEKPNFEKVTSVVRARKGCCDESTKDLVYVIFGIISPYEDSVYRERRDACEVVFKFINSKIAKLKKLFLIEHCECFDYEEIKIAHKNNISKNYEGTVIYQGNGIYLEGARNSNLIKVKEFSDAEGVIVNVTNGKGKELEKAIFEVEIKQGTTMLIRPAADDATRKEWLRNPNTVIGKKLTYTYQELTKSGIPRFPVGRAIRDYE